MSPKKKTARLSRCKVKQEHVALPDWKDNDLLTRQEAAAYAKVCVRTLTKWVRLKKLPEYRIEGVNRIPFGELKKFLANKDSLPQPATPAQPTDITKTQEFREAYEVMWNIDNPAYSGHTFGLDFDSDMKVFKEMEEWKAKVKRVRGE